MAEALNYGAAPAAGTSLTWSGQGYMVRTAHAFLLSGKPAGTILWSTACPSCGGTFTFETGFRRRHLPKRCKACDPTGDVDAAERKAFAKRAWHERLEAGKARKREAAQSEPVSIDRAALQAGTGLMLADVVCANGARLRVAWKPGADLSSEIAPIQKAVPLLEREHARLTLGV